MVCFVLATHKHAHTFTDGSIGRELVPDRTGTQRTPGFISTQVAAAAVIQWADSSCRKCNMVQHHRWQQKTHKHLSASHQWENEKVKVSGRLLQACDSSLNLPQVMGSSLPSEQWICPSHRSSEDRHVPSGQRTPFSPHWPVRRDNQDL